MNISSHEELRKKNLKRSIFQSMVKVSFLPSFLSITSTFIDIPEV